jgi:GNAT superfamily N-acetyltransferase
MKNTRSSGSKRFLHQFLRKVFSYFPQGLRFAVYRSFVDCDPNPDKRLVLKIAQTKEELEACFKLLHDAYVASGFMAPHPSGMRITIYHALPTTTTLCAMFDGEVVGTLSLIRESAFGFPLQSVFDLQEVREKEGRLAEVSALAVHPKFRNTGGTILFPLMKFMYDYCSAFFDTRHLVIAVNPNRIEMYESLLFFERLKQATVDNYDFANGAPAIGASVDLHHAPGLLRKAYHLKPRRKNLYHYFVRSELRNIVMPGRRYFTTNDPVMTPDLMDYFFNKRSNTFDLLDDRDRGLLHSIYNLPQYKALLPCIFSETDFRIRQRKHQRYSLKCPGNFVIGELPDAQLFALRVVELSDDGFLARSKAPLPQGIWGEACIRLGKNETSRLRARVIRGKFDGSQGFYGFKLESSDLPWRKLVSVLKAGTTHEDLENSTQFLRDGNV